VRFYLPEVIRIYDHEYGGSKIECEYQRGFCLSWLQRFSRVSSKEKLVIVCLEKDLVVNPRIPLEDQGIEPGDRLDVYPHTQGVLKAKASKRRPRVSIF
jgi:hypothetical protein